MCCWCGKMQWPRGGTSQFLHAVCASLLLNESDARCAHDWHHLRATRFIFSSMKKEKNTVTLCMSDTVCLHAYHHVQNHIETWLPILTWKACYANYIYEGGNINMLLLHGDILHRAPSQDFPVLSAAELGTSQSISRLMNAVAQSASSPCPQVFKWHLKQQYMLWMLTKWKP